MLRLAGGAFLLQVIFYSLVLFDLSTCSFNSSLSEPNDEDSGLESGCRYTYPNYVTPYVISCRNMYVNDIPFHENVTKMELINVPLSVLNDTLIPAAIQSSSVTLRQLQWSKSHIKVLERISIFHLIDLDISWNVIQEIRFSSLHHLTNLKKLNVSHNNVDKLPNNLFDENLSLTVLSFSHNRLMVIPSTIFNPLESLKILDLSNNQLSHLKDGQFRHNSRLLILNLSHNKITSVSPTLFLTTNLLQNLGLEDNHLFSIEPDTFSHLHDLMELNMAHNPLWSLPSTLLPNNNTLYKLAISGTRLLKIRPSVLHNLKSLCSLVLSDNYNLQNLHNEIFANLRNLTTANLQNNNFTQLPFSLLNTNIEDLYLDGNPWPCDCSLQWIPIWIEIASEGKNGPNLHLKNRCNETRVDLVKALREMKCKPNIVRMSSSSYQMLDVNAHLTCRAFSNPQPIVSWITPNGFVYVESQDSGDALKYRPVFESYQHLQTVTENVQLHQNGDLDIKRMSRDDAGEYTCIAINPMGESLASTRLHVDPSIMQRLKAGSIICGILWVNTFLLFSIVYLVIRRYSRRTKREKRTQRMQHNMDTYKSQQIVRLRERSKNQMNRIKNNCCIQVDWMKENYKESMSNSQDHRISYLTNQYNTQMTEIREYYLSQMQQIHAHYNQQRNQILEYHVMGFTNTDSKNITTENDCVVDSLAKTENGQPVMPTTEDEEIYKYHELIKNEIQMLTSQHNLYTTLADGTSHRNNTTSSATSENRHTANFYSPKIEYVPNGKLHGTPEEELDERTCMLSMESR